MPGANPVNEEIEIGKKRAEAINMGGASCRAIAQILRYAQDVPRVI
jgi:hypothetical protein